MRYAEPAAELVTVRGERILFAQNTISVANFLRNWAYRSGITYNGVPVNQILIREAWGGSKVVIYTINGWIPFQYETTPKIMIIQR